MRTKTKRMLVFAAAVVAAAALPWAWRRRAGARSDAARDAGRFALRKLAAGDVADARRFAELALASRSDVPDARFVRAVLRSSSGDPRGALLDLEACARGDPRDFAVCLDAGVLARALGADEAAPADERARRWFVEAS